MQVLADPYTSLLRLAKGMSLKTSSITRQSPSQCEHWYIQQHMPQATILSTFDREST